MQKTEQSPDYYLNDFTLIGMGESGSPRHQLAAESLVHFAEDGSSELIVPKLVYFPNIRNGDEKIKWRMNAVTGKAYDDGELIVFGGDVKIRRYSGRDEVLTLSIDTKDLRVNVDQEVAETNRPVVIYDALGRINAIGMWADLKNGRLKLVSRVRGDYDVAP